MDPADLHRLVVPSEQAGRRLDIVLAADPRVGSRRASQALIAGGHVALPGLRQNIKAGLFLAAGQVVEFRVIPEAPAPTVHELAAQAPPLRILHEDEFLLVIDKPPGIAAHPPEGARRHPQPTVATLAEAHCGPLPRLGGDDRPGIVHRLDKDTSGVMLVVKNDEAFHFVQAQFRARTTQKEYRCVSYGEARFDSDWVEGAIADHPTRPERMVVVREGGREASTYYEVVERFAGFVHLRCQPKTGRTHQIRVHMERASLSLVGDRVYRARNQQHCAVPDGAPPVERQMLHAFKITLTHPWTHEVVTFSAPMPDDMEQLLAWLRVERPLAKGE